MGKTTLRGPAMCGFPAFIWIYLISMGLSCTRCTAQQTRLPGDLAKDMRNRLCNGCDGISECDASIPDQRCPLCQQICKMGKSRRQCWREMDNICSNGGFSSTFCGYQDAVVCRNDSNVYCVFRFCPLYQVPLCTGSLGTPYASNPEWARNRSTCSIGSPTSDTRPGDGSGSFHATTIALACVLSIVLLLVIIGAGVWYLRRRGKLPAFMTKNRSPNEPSTELEVQAAKRAPIPTPPALGSAEYSYAYGQRPDTGGANAMNKDNDEYHYYSSLDKDGVGEKSARYVKDGPGSVKVPSMEAPSDHDYFALEKADKDEDAHVKDGGHNEGVLSPEDDDDHTYFPLQKTPERPSGNANSDYEVAKPAPTGGSEAEEASSPYDRLDRGNKPTDEGVLSDDYQHLKDN